MALPTHDEAGSAAAPGARGPGRGCGACLRRDSLAAGRDALRVDDAAAGPARAIGSVLGGLSGVVARLRQAKPLHPVGTVVRGRLLRHGAAGSGAAWLDTEGDDDVVVRLSRGGGLPPWLPDVDGLALRHEVPGCPVVDVLLSTTGALPGARHMLVMRRVAGGGTYTSLLPYRGPHGPVVLAAEARPRRRLPADPAERARVLAREPWRLRLSWAPLRGPWEPFGWLEVGGPVEPAPDPPIRFDPMNTPPGLGTYRWVAALREPAYAAARRATPGPARRGRR